MSTAQVALLKKEQLTTDQYAALIANRISPLVLDLDNDGIETVDVNYGVVFDLLGVGQSLRVGWVGPDDGLLARDIDGNGQIDSGRELFGQGTRITTGTASDGFHALAQMDTNKDGIIDWSDIDFSQLMVWKDANVNGFTDPGELTSLSKLGIQSLSIEAVPGHDLNQGNLLGLVSHFTTENGNQQAMVDVWFVVEELHEEKRQRRDGLLGIPPQVQGTEHSS